MEKTKKCIPSSSIQIFIKFILLKGQQTPGSIVELPECLKMPIIYFIQCSC